MAREHDQPHPALHEAGHEQEQLAGITAERRRFLRTAGLGGLALALPGVLAACAKEAVAPAALGLTDRKSVV